MCVTEEKKETQKRFEPVENFVVRLVLTVHLMLYFQLNLLEKEKTIIKEIYECCA